MSSTQTTKPSSARRFDNLVIVLFLVAIAAPMLTLWLPAADSEDEQRVRAPYPALESFSTFPDRMEAYLNDHFGFRDRLIDGYNRLMTFGLNTSPNRKVVLGDRGWLYFNGDPATGDASPIRDYLGSNPLTPGKLEAMRWMFQDQHEWLRVHGIPYTLVFIPSKPELYPESIPARLHPTGHPTWREQFITYLASHTDVPVLDLTPDLLAARERRNVYVPTDTHWNDFGAYSGYASITRHLAKRYPGLTVVPETAFDVLTPDELGGDLARMIGLDDEFRAPRIRLQPKTPRRGNPQQVAEGRFVNTIGGTGDPDQPTAYIYHDSYSEVLIPFLAESFREVEFEWGQKGSRMVGIEDRKPDEVLQIMADRVLDMDLIYAPRIYQEQTEKRFEQAGHIYLESTHTNSFGGLVVGRGIDTSFHKGGLALGLDGKRGRIGLPELKRVDELLPILRVQIQPTANTTLTLVDDGDTVLYRRPLTRGRNDLYMTVFDPELTGPLSLEFDGKANALLYAVDIRGYPRKPKDSD